MRNESKKPTEVRAGPPATPPDLVPLRAPGPSPLRGLARLLLHLADRRPPAPGAPQEQGGAGPRADGHAG